MPDQTAITSRTSAGDRDVVAAQQHRVGKAEHGGAGANAHGERGNGESGEGRRLGEDADAVADVLHQAVERLKAPDAARALPGTW